LFAYALLKIFFNYVVFILSSSTQVVKQFIGGGCPLAQMNRTE